MSGSSHLLTDAGPLLTLAVGILTGTIRGTLAKRLALPSITGPVLAGVLVGKSGLALLGDGALHGVDPLTDFALGLIAVTVGAHLNLKRLRNAGRRLLVLLGLEITLTPALVYVAIRWLAGRSDAEAVLFATVAIATAPATIVARVREARARGVFVKPLVAAVAFNNLACIFLFEAAHPFAVANISGVAHLSTACSTPTARPTPTTSSTRKKPCTSTTSSTSRRDTPPPMAEEKARKSPLAPHDDKSRHVKPLGPRVLVRILPGDDRSSGGLYLPVGSKDAVATAAYGEVVEVARASDEDGEGFGRNVSGIPEGVRVLFPKTEGLPVPWDDALRVVEVKHIFAVVEEIEPDEVH